MAIDTPAAKRDPQTPATVTPGASAAPRWTTHERLQAWIEEVVALTTPDAVHVCDGSDEEWTALTDAMVESGTLTRLQAKPNSFLAASDPTDVARVEDRTFICSVDPKDAGPTNNWMDPAEMKGILMTSCTAARCRAARCTSSPSSWAGSTWSTRCSASSSPTPPTSSPPCAIMTRMGREVLQAIEDRHADFVPACTRSACRSTRARTTCRGPATRPSTSSSSPRSG
jgi:phosphoenolpyruvate carboxykinase (GTP)